jgi:hypothetical protein
MYWTVHMQNKHSRLQIYCDFSVRIQNLQLQVLKTLATIIPSYKTRIIFPPTSAIFSPWCVIPQPSPLGPIHPWFIEALNWYYQLEAAHGKSKTKITKNIHSCANFQWNDLWQSSSLWTLKSTSVSTTFCVVLLKKKKRCLCTQTD